jgi:hypothetical protein
MKSAGIRHGGALPLIVLMRLFLLAAETSRNFVIANVKAMFSSDFKLMTIWQFVVKYQNI